MWFNTETGEYVEARQSFTYEDRSFPAGWLAAADNAELARLKFVPVRTVGAVRDERYYDNVTTRDGAVITITSTPKPRAGVEAKMWEAIKAYRDLLLRSDISVAGSIFHTDSDSRIQFLALKSLADAAIAAGGTSDTPLTVRGNTIMWKTVSDEFVPMTAGLAQSIVTAIAEREYDVFMAGEQHKAAMEASEDPGSYDFSGTWS